MPQEISKPLITQLLKRWEKGEQDALEELLPMVYQQLRRIARHYMHGERPNHTFSTVDLVHEAYCKIFGSAPGGWENRNHFFAVAAKAMRFVLVTHAHSRNAAKRGGGEVNWVPLDLTQLGSEPDQLLNDLDEAIGLLEQRDPQAARAVELCYFCGFTQDEIAEALGTSVSTVKRKLNFSKAILGRFLSQTNRDLT